MTGKCYMIRSPKVCVVYVYPMDGANGFMAKAGQFIASYAAHPPGLDHDTAIICNGAAVTDHAKALFSDLPGVSFVTRDNAGWDIGAFQHAASTIDCDLMVFFGAHTYFRRAGWLARMMEAYGQFGNTLYGATGSQGNLAFNVYPHVRTTAFWCHPSLIAEYPHGVASMGAGGQRYEFEHGKSCLSNWVRERGLQPWIVGWDCVHPLQSCDNMPNGFHQGDQSNVLVGDRLTMPPFHPTA